MRIFVILFLLSTITALSQEVKWWEVNVNWERVDTSTGNNYGNIDCKDSLNCIAVGTDNHSQFYLRRTTDGGLTWNSMEVELYEQNNWLKSSLVEYYSDELIIVGFEKGIIAHTTNLGENWQYIDLPGDRDIYSIEMKDSKSGIITLNNGDVLLTSDGGKNWYNANINKPDEYPGMSQSLSITENYLYLMFMNNKFVGNIRKRVTKILKSSDFGESWEKLDGPDDGIRFEFVNDNVGWAYGMKETDTVAEFKYRDVIYKTEDGGETWQLKLDTLGMKFVTKLKSSDFINQNYGCVLGGNYHVWHTTDGGNTWKQLIKNLDQVPDPNFVDAAYPQMRHPIVIDFNGDIYRYDETTDVKYKFNVTGKSKIVPNPNSGTFDLILESKVTGKMTVKIFSYSGVQLFEETFEKTSAHVSWQINPQLPAKGVYFYKIEKDSQLLSSGSFVVK